MKISSRLDGSIAATVLSFRPRSPSTQFFHTYVDGSQPHRTKPPASAIHTSRHVHRVRCPKTAQWLLSALAPHHTQWRSITTSTRCAGVAGAAAQSRSQSASLAGEYSEDDLLSFTDSQGTPSVDELLSFHRDPYLRKYAESDGPKITVSDRTEDTDYPSHEEATRGDDRIREISGRLNSAIRSHLRSPLRTSIKTVFGIYTKLPEPKMLHISATMRHRLLRVLGTPEKRDMESMLRYYSVVSDIKDSGLSLRRTEWNYALSYASRYVGNVTEAKLESTLQLWSEMERDAGIKGNEVTFNILFDAASKSGNFTLAEMIYKEMEARRIKFNRYHHVSLIHYFGLKMDSDGVRAAYREMVRSGEIIDTTVLNCVVSGLLRSGEESAALRVYDRMKAISTEPHDMPQRNYGSNKVITKVLMMLTRVGRQHPVMRSSLQRTTRLTPDLQTYRILVGHYAIKAGDLGMVSRFLDEMRWFQLPLHGAIFLALFKGFATHGGYPDADWSGQRLQDIFTALVRGLAEGAKGLYIDTWLAMWILRAFKKCFNDDRMVMEVYNTLQQRWNLNQSKAEFMERFLHTLLCNKVTLHVEN